MNYLEGLAVRSGEDTQHRMLAEPQKFPQETHFPLAEKLLTKAAPIVLEKVVPNLEDFPGRWNPGGFMVFPLGIHEDLGSLRLHIWPAGVPRETEQGPNIHDHGWHLSSRVLAGQYADTIFELKDVSPSDIDGLNIEKGLLRLYQTKRNAGGQDTLVTDGTIVKAISIADRQVVEGQIHHIPFGVYHKSDIPVDRLTATLVLDSPAFVGSTGVLLNSDMPVIARSRREIDRSSAILAKSQLMQYGEVVLKPAQQIKIQRG